MFYGAIVVPVGTKVLGSEIQQGFVTQSVTNYLNVIGIIAVIMWLGEMLLCRDADKIRRYSRWTLLILLMLMLGILGWLHTKLDHHLDAEAQLIFQTDTFTKLHSWYLIVSTLQWAVSIVFTGLTLRSWQDGKLVKNQDNASAFVVHGQ